MPFGLTNAPAAFQRLMECVLSGLNYEQYLLYLDDIGGFKYNILTVMAGFQTAYFGPAG